MAKKTKKQDSRYSLKGSCLWGVLVFALLIFIDQITKFAADVYFNMEGVAPMVLIPNGVLSLCISYNDGIAFGGFGESGAATKIAIVVGTGVLMLALAVMYFKVDKRRSFLRNSLVFVVAGGVGNLIDRLYYQIWIPSEFGVRDMVQIDFGGLFGFDNFLNFVYVTSRHRFGSREACEKLLAHDVNTCVGALSRQSAHYEQLPGVTAVVQSALRLGIYFL